METKVIAGEGYQYKCDVDKSLESVTLHNLHNKFTYIKWLKKDGSKIREDVYFGRIPTLEQDEWTRQKCFSIVNNAFSIQQKTLVGIYPFSVNMIVDSTTGKVAEVYFSFGEDSPYQQIPVSVFRKIELELKQNIWFTLTDEGRKLNYCMRHWVHEF